MTLLHDFSIIAIYSRHFIVISYFTVEAIYHMKRVKTAELVPGMVTGEDVFNFNGQMIFPKGFILTDRAISRLSFYAIDSLRVEDEIIEAPAPKPVEQITVPSHKQRIINSPEFKEFKESFDTEVELLRDRINRIVSENAPINTDEMLAGAFKLVEMGRKSFGVIDLLNHMRDNDGETFAHCMNVALICNVMCGWLRYDKETTRMATLCGLFHDIGKLHISDAILEKRGPLTDEERKIVQTHALEGFNLIKNLPLDEHVKNAALMHHERCDGTGYPFGLTPIQIDPYAKMVAIADVYDAMTSTRPYRRALSPFKTIAIMEDEGLQKYDTQYVTTFLDHVVDSYINNRVLLNTGEQGEIVYIHKEKLSRPTLKIGDKFLDLSQSKDIEIEEII